MKPVDTPIIEAVRLGITRRRPEDVADSRRTAWKKRGMLKRMEFMIIA